MRLAHSLAPLIGCAVALALCTIPVAGAREPYFLCGIDAERFMRFAFPSNGAVYVDRLTKWAMVPNLIVLSNRPELKPDVDLALAQIAEEQVFRDAQLVFVPYREASEIGLAARNYGFNNLFILIDEDAFAQGPRQADLQREVEAILGSGDLAEGLFVDTNTNRWPATRFHTRPGLAVDAAVAVLPPGLGREKLVSHIHAIYFMVHAPAAWMIEPEASMSAMFERTDSSNVPQGRLSAFGRTFFSVLADTRVATAARPEDFERCANQ